MLQSLVIQNFAIIEHLELDFDAGMTVITGETGAGKSIIIDALGLLLGDRTDKSVVRAGAQQCDITAIIDLSHNDNAQTWLQEHEFEQDENCILRRVIRKDGKSRAYINDTPTSVKKLKELGELLINIYGQHAHQQLMEQKTQRELLDRFGGSEALARQLEKQYRVWQQAEQKLQHARDHQTEYQSQIELLRYQTEELNALQLEEDELETLEQRLMILSNAASLQETSELLHNALDNDDNSGVYDQLAALQHKLQAALDIDPKLQNIHEQWTGLLELINDCSAQLRDYTEQVEYDSTELQQTQSRLADIDQLARKHHTSGTELIALHNRLDEQLSQLESPELDIEHLQRTAADEEKSLHALASELSQQRGKAAKALGKAVTKEMKQLGLDKAYLFVTLESSERPTAHGFEQVQYLIQTNPGQPAQPLEKIASGGELSRISLALQLILLDKMQVESMIFDEVDSGVGGATAEVVGTQLRRLGESKQVFCVTHLPQVAAKAHHHLRVNKQSRGHYTNSAVDQLDNEQRIEEVARMLGGVKLTENTYLHAREMLQFDRLQ